MDSLFLLSEGDRANFLQQIMQAFNCTYICLWSYLPHPSNFLLCLDGLYREPANPPSSSSSSSSASLAQRLFNEYRQVAISVDNGVPGLAFKNHVAFMKLEFSDLQGLASIEIQLRFYLESGIKTAVFMGCNAGEIEFGMSNHVQQVNLEIELRTWFPEDFSRLGDFPLPADQNRPSSSSSSLRSLSVDDSSDYSPLLFNISSSSPRQQAMRSAAVSTTTSPRQQTIQALSQIRSIQFPSIEIEDAALTKAMLAVISSPTTSSSPQTEQKFPAPRGPPAFQRYRFAGLAPRTRSSRPNMFRRAVAFYRNLNLLQRQAEQVQGNIRPASTQLHHMISERRRREKLNESFQALRSLLPPGTKKDKASVLANTTEYLSKLKSQVEELNKINQILEAQLLQPEKEAAIEEQEASINERVEVRTRQVSTSTLESEEEEARIIDLEVGVRGQHCNMLDLVICILEFLKRLSNINLVSVDAHTRLVGSSSVNRVMLRLQIEGEWDESAFQGAIRRVVDDLAQ